MEGKKEAFRAAEKGNFTGLAAILGLGAISAIPLWIILAIIGVIGAVTVVFLPVVLAGMVFFIVTGATYYFGLKPIYSAIAGVGSAFLSFILVKTMGVTIFNVSGMAEEAATASSIPGWSLVLSVIVSLVSMMALYDATR